MPLMPTGGAIVTVLALLYYRSAFFRSSPRDKASRSAALEVTPSFGKVWYRCVATVRCDKNSRSPICLFVRPAAARVAISRSHSIYVSQPKAVASLIEQAAG
jgi:hypothetical protein